MQNEALNIDNTTVKVTHKIWTAGNIVSLSRAVIGFVIVYVHMYHGGTTVLFGTLVAAGILSDYIDGWLARSRNEVSELGKVLDPVADKIMAGILFTYGVFLGFIPLWFLLMSLARDGIIVIGSVFLKNKFGKVAMSVMSGKIFVNILALYWMAVFFFPGFTAASQFLMWMSVFAMVFSFFDYLHRFRNIIKGRAYN